MNKRITHSLILAILAIMLISCNTKSKNSANIPPPLKPVEVPTVITDPLQRENYISQHFWDNFDFSDSAHLSLPTRLDAYYIEYLNHLYSSDEQSAMRSSKIFTSSLCEGHPALRDYYLKIIESSLNDPNSPFRNETLYIWILEALVQSDKIDGILKERYKEQLELALKNRPGSTALDFEYSTVKGKSGTVHKLNSEFTLLFFYEPNCPICDKALDFIKTNLTFKEMSERVIKLALYTGDDIALWHETSEKFSSDWVVAHDNNLVISLNRLYDRRPSPSIYLLDRDKKVILKDALPDEVAEYFRQLQ